MKRILPIVGSLCLGAVTLQSAPQKFSLTDYSSMSVEQKRKVFNGTESPELDDPQKFLDLFILGLNDSDQVVRRRATQTLAMTMVALQQVKREEGAVPVNLSKLKEVQQDLVNMLSDQDEGTRGAAIKSLAYSGAPNSETENLLLAQFASEPNAQIQAGIIETMAFAGYDSDRYKDVLVQSLNGNHEVEIAAARAVAFVKPPNALSILGALLEKGEGGGAPELEAIGAYGKDAQPLLPILKKLQNNASEAVDKALVKKVIAGIESPNLEASIPANVKAIALAESDSVPPGGGSAAGAPAASATVAPTPTLANTVPVRVPVVPITTVASLEHERSVWQWLAGAIALVLVIVAVRQWTKR